MTINNDYTQINNREEYLIKATDLLKQLVIEPAINRAKLDFNNDFKISVSIGHPKSKKALGECWNRNASEDKKTNQIFITPFENDTAIVLSTLCHEIIHAYDNLESGHKGKFATLARAIDLQGKLTATYAGDTLKAELLDIVDILGDIPHTKLDAELSGRPKQKARMLKIECELCQFTFRASKTQIERLPMSATCPCCNESNSMHKSIFTALS